jgi:hypothetical protein
MTTLPTSSTGWRDRQPARFLDDDDHDNALSAEIEAALAVERDEAVPTHWEDFLARGVRTYHLPAALLDRLIAEAVADAMPEIALLIERKLRYLIRGEQRALLQSCDAY